MKYKGGGVYSDKVSASPSSSCGSLVTRCFCTHCQWSDSMEMLAASAGSVLQASQKWSSHCSSWRICTSEAEARGQPPPRPPPVRDVSR